MSAPATAQPLKLEVGKAYRTRDGRKVEITGYSSDALPSECVFVGNREGGNLAVPNWTIDGRYDPNQGPTPHDLIAEWDAPDADGSTSPQPVPGTVTTGNLKTTPLEGVGKNPSPEPDYKDIAHEMAAQLGMAIIRLRANPDWLGVLVNRETGERYSWEESFARSIERLPDTKVDRRYLEAKQLPAKQRRARYAELEAEKRAKEPPCPTS